MDRQRFDNLGLTGLGERLKEDLDCLLYPGKEWVPPKDGVTDIAIIGGGMCGMVAWLALTTGGMRNIRVLDRAQKGQEGPWLNYARMETLRSPKNLTGPSFGHGALTFQAWYRAQFGEVAWKRMDKIPRRMWMDYLRWYRDTLEIPIENGVFVDHLEPDGDLLRLSVSGAETDTIVCRKVIFATGRDGIGGPNIPGFIRKLAPDFWAHSADEIDFAALKNKCVAVIGVGASAVDNSAEALEHGAAEVRHLIRRNEMPTINKMMGIGSYGFTAGYAALPDEWRWRFMQYAFATQTPPPHGSTLRVSRHENAYFHFGKETIRINQQGRIIKIFFADGTSYCADYLILATGFVIDPMSRTEFGKNAGNIMLWQDIYTPPSGEENEDLGRFPYLHSDFTFQEKNQGSAPWLSNVYCFNYGAAVSLGKVSGDIPGISEGAAWLAREVAAKLYAEDVGLHWQGMLDYDKPELDGTEWKPIEPKQKTSWGRVA
jgi:hypothetical protein